MSITTGLKHLGFVPLEDFICQDDGDGAYIKEWLSDSPQPTEEELSQAITDGVIADNLKGLRMVRNVKLAETDWVVTMHKELGTNIPTAWKTYRQALRDITDDATSLDDVTWPEKP